jgi:hypothetical protein
MSLQNNSKERALAMNITRQIILISSVALQSHIAVAANVQPQDVFALAKCPHSSR